MPASNLYTWSGWLQWQWGESCERATGDMRRPRWNTPAGRLRKKKCTEAHINTHRRTHTHRRRREPKRKTKKKGASEWSTNEVATSHFTTVQEKAKKQREMSGRRRCATRRTKKEKKEREEDSGHTHTHKNASMDGHERRVKVWQTTGGGDKRRCSCSHNNAREGPPRREGNRTLFLWRVCSLLELILCRGRVAVVAVHLLYGRHCHLPSPSPLFRTAPPFPRLPSFPA